MIYSFNFIFIVLGTVCLSFSTAWKFRQDNNKPSPIVIIPGLGGTQSFAQLPSGRKPFPIWISPKYLIFMKTLTAYFKLSYDPKTRRTHDSALANISFPGWGETWSVENLGSVPTPFTSYFGPLVNQLVKNPFYVRNKTLRSAPYDFRRAPNEADHYFKKLKLLIEETYHNGGDRRVMLLSHSMGGLYTIYFLKIMPPSWRKKYIRGHIAVATPVAGSMDGVRSTVTGYNLGIILLKPKKLREIERSMPAMTFCLPNVKYWSKKEALVVTPMKNYTVFDYQQLFDDMKVPNIYEMYKDTRSLVDPDKDVPQVDEVYCIHGQNWPTAKQFVFSKMSMFPDHPSKIINEDGDGTVNLRSLLACKKWPGVVHRVFPGTKHFRMFRYKNVIAYITGIMVKGD